MRERANDESNGELASGSSCRAAVVEPHKAAMGMDSNTRNDEAAILSAARNGAYGPAIQLARMVRGGRWAELEDALIAGRDPQAILQYHDLIMVPPWRAEVFGSAPTGAHTYPRMMADLEDVFLECAEDSLRREYLLHLSDEGKLRVLFGHPADSYNQCLLRSQPLTQPAARSGEPVRAGNGS